MALGDTWIKKLLVLGPLLLILLTAGAAVAPHAVYDQFVWKYFWGPIVADAGTGSITECPVTLPTMPTADIACRNGVVAHSGYTIVNEIGYGAALIYLLILLVAVLKRLDVGREQNFVLYFVPFIVGGGMLRVVEDVASNHPELVGFPFRYFLISPLIYFTMFGIVFATLLGGVYLSRHDIVGDYKQVVAGGGTVFSAAVLGVILRHSIIAEGWMVPATLGGAAVVLTAYVFLLRSFTGIWPGIRHVLGAEGVTVLYGHLVDGVSTALSLDVLGMVEKHPIPRLLIEYTGTPYTFILAKLGLITLILYYMDEDVREDDPLFFNLILLGILAVGMGPGVRNMTRAVLGV